MHGAMDDKDFRKKLNAVYNRVAKALDAADPDRAEVELSLGSCVIGTPQGKIILSPQPPVCQLWLAAASQGIAGHFNWDAATETWIDDKGRGEFYALLRDIVRKASGLDISF